jgi:leucyl-tRNA synthetase
MMSCQQLHHPLLLLLLLLLLPTCNTDGMIYQSNHNRQRYGIAWCSQTAGHAALYGLPANGGSRGLLFQVPSLAAMLWNIPGQPARVCVGVDERASYVWECVILTRSWLDACCCCLHQVRDDKGRKMSKSLGNVIDPLEVVGQYGTDALRFTMATGT